MGERVGGVQMDIDPAIGILCEHEILREGLGRILVGQGFRLICCSSSLQDFLNDEPALDLIIVDADLTEGHAQICSRIKLARPGVRLLIIADEVAPDDVAEAFRSGIVDGYVIKNIACNALAGAVRLVAMGEKVFPSEIIRARYSLAMSFHAHGERAAAAKLSARELEILSCLFSWDANKVISRRLNIADATVKVHIKAILRKLQVANRTQAAIWAVGCGLMPSYPKAVQSAGAPERFTRFAA